jgi:hypothetical protein
LEEKCERGGRHTEKSSINQEKFSEKNGSMKEIGGYIEFEKYEGKMLHEDGILLNCGRSCLAYLIVARKIKKIAMPYFMCDSIFRVCRKHGVQIRFYHINKDLRPEDIHLDKNEWFYLMSFYGQMAVEEIEGIGEKYKRVIVDFTHDYFHEPIGGLDTLYTCRKFFGVSDGAVLYTDAEKIENLETDESYGRIRHLCGRFERTALEFYTESSANNKFFDEEPIKKMSKLTFNLLHGIDYKKACERRTQNFACLHRRLEGMNGLKLRITKGAYAYPLLVKGGARIRKLLVKEHIYVATLWPNIIGDMPKESMEYYLAENILPLPCDHRYDLTDMEYMAEMVERMAASAL